jgi:hypothetical protein
MTNDEARMRHGVRWLVFVGSFRLRHSFVIRHWAFVIDFYQWLASEHATALAPAALCALLFALYSLAFHHGLGIVERADSNALHAR